MQKDDTICNMTLHRYTVCTNKFINLKHAYNNNYYKTMLKHRCSFQTLKYILSLSTSIRQRRSTSDFSSRAYSSIYTISTYIRGFVTKDFRKTCQGPSRAFSSDTANCNDVNLINEMLYAAVQSKLQLCKANSKLSISMMGLTLIQMVLILTKV